MKTINYIDIGEEEISEHNNQIVLINKGNIEYKVWLNFKPDFDKLLIFFTNNLELYLKDHDLIVYNKDLSSSILIIEELTAVQKGLEYGFALGDGKTYYLDDYKEIISLLALELNILNDNIYFYGEYSHGFISILLSTLIENSNSVVHNPIIFVQRIDQKNKKELYDAIYPGLSDKEILKKSLKKFSTTVHMRQNNIAPNIFYIQNKQDDTFATQYSAFTNKIERYNIHDGNIIKMFYSNKKLIGTNISDLELIELFSTIMANKSLEYKDDNVYFNSKATLVLQDDDTRQESYDLLYKFGKENNIPITFGVNSGHILGGTKNRITESQFKEMVADKDIVEFVNHTHSHIRLTELNVEEIENEIRLCQEFIESYGIYTRHLIYPFGKVNDEIINIASKYVDSATKTNGKIINPKSPDYNLFMLNRMSFESELDKIENNILKAIETNGCIIINIHAQYETFSIEKLKKIIKLTKKYKLDIVHISEAIKHLEE